MSEDTRDTNPQQTPPAPAEPPGGGRQNHEVMQAASMRGVSGAASTHVLAAGGGLEVPAREADTASALSPAPGSPRYEERIPGERERDTLTHREPGAVSGQFSGADIPAAAPQNWMDDRTALDRAREGGGGPRKQEGRRKEEEGRRKE